jgi:hypothetical protein
VRLQPWTLLADCRAREACASLLDSRPESVKSLSDAEGLLETVLRTSIALAEWTSIVEWIPCADVDSEGVLSVLRESVPTLAPGSECEQSGPVDGSGLIHRTTGAPAGRFQVGVAERSGSDVLVRSSTYSGPRGATVWRCLFGRVREEWAAKHCLVVLRS